MNPVEIRTKNTVLNAIKFTGDNANEVCQFIGKELKEAHVLSEYIGFHSDTFSLAAKKNEWIIDLSNSFMAHCDVVMQTSDKYIVIEPEVFYEFFQQCDKVRERLNDEMLFKLLNRQTEIAKLAMMLLEKDDELKDVITQNLKLKESFQQVEEIFSEKLKNLVNSQKSTNFSQEVKEAISGMNLGMVKRNNLIKLQRQEILDLKWQIKYGLNKH